MATDGTIDGGRSVDDLQGALERLASENAQLQSKLRIRARLRSVATGLLVLVTSLLVVASTVAV